MEEVIPINPDAKRIWFEPVTAILMAVASLSTAWCSYQSSRWSGESAAHETRADFLGRQAAEQHLEAQQIHVIHMATWMEAMDAQIDGDEKLTKFYTDRFGEELKPAYDKWIALKPFENPAAPPHPFVPELYSFRFTQEIRDAKSEAATAEKQSNIAGHYADAYLSNTVILATVLFFAGTMEKFNQRHVRWASLAFAVALFAFATVRMILLPVA
jgi:hypothetical protein